MSIQNQCNFFLWLILFVSTTEVFAQAPQDPQIASSGFGENLSTGCPRLQIIDLSLCFQEHDFLRSFRRLHVRLQSYTALSGGA